MRYDLVVTGGTVIDPASGLRGPADVAIADGRIVAVAPGIGTTDAADAVNATGCLVVPGLVDLHVHVYWGVADLSIRPGPNDLERGATTIVDAGSSGANTFPGFRRYVIEPFDGRILALLNISAMGQIDPFLGELHDERYLIPERAAAVALAHPDRIVGFKVRLTETLTGPNARIALERAVAHWNELARVTMSTDAFEISYASLKGLPADKAIQGCDLEQADSKEFRIHRAGSYMQWRKLGFASSTQIGRAHV